MSYNSILQIWTCQVQCWFEATLNYVVDGTTPTQDYQTNNLTLVLVTEQPNYFISIYKDFKLFKYLINSLSKYVFCGFLIGDYSLFHALGIASMIVSFLVCIFYNTIMAWVLWYFFHSFQNPLPWSQCPINESLTGNTIRHLSCTSYFYRHTLIATTTVTALPDSDSILYGQL